ncbi:MAG: MBL fold metallo-hydrolase [Ignavibacteria bacterium]|nr:MBL fold metallo-hydrolase [Ignavibacteria bacterium]
MRTLSRILIFIMLVTSLSGCRILFDVGDNIMRSFSSPEKIKNRIKDPIRPGVKLSALWVGHATILLQIGDKVILTDPFLTNFIAEIQMRIKEPGIDINDLKQCDIILISHSHFDHLNLGSLGILEKKFPKADLIFPENAKEFIPKIDFNLHPLKIPAHKKKKYIGETKIIDGVEIICVAAYHWGGRYGLDGLLWGYDGFCGFIIKYNGYTVYFPGDTAYDEEFYKFLGENYEIDLEFMPIGPCSDCTLVDKPDRHLYPKGALKILDDTKAKLMIPMHYGTIAELSEPEEPKRVLEELIREQPQYKDRVKILKIGEQIVIE